MELKDLINRIYEDKKCVAFMLPIWHDSEDGSQILICMLRYRKIDYATWEVVTDITSDDCCVVYQHKYLLPTHDLPLIKIASIGAAEIKHKIEQMSLKYMQCAYNIGEVFKNG